MDKLKKEVGSRVKSLVKNVTLEPAIFMLAFGAAVVTGSGIDQRLLLWKVCHVELHHEVSICDHLSDPANEAVKDEVQIFSNVFKMKNDQLRSWPALVYVVFAGALSDRYGRKYLILMPMIGAWMNTVLDIVHYGYITVFPLEFYYLQNWYWLFGGHSIFFMGIYTYGSDITDPSKKALRFSIYDGIEMIGKFTGTLISPYAFDSVGYYGVFLFKLGLVSVACGHVLWSVRNDSNSSCDETELENVEETMGEGTMCQRTRTWLSLYLVAPVKEFISSLLRRRHHHMRTILHLELLAYLLFVLAYPYVSDIYNYMLKVFPDFTGDRFAHVGASGQLSGILALLVVIPVLSWKARLHETTLMVMTTTTVFLGLILSAFARNIFPDFAVGYSLAYLKICQWSLIRAVIARTVERREVGKLFSAVSVITSLFGTAAGPLMKLVYNVTLESFPAAFLLYAAGLYLLATALSLVPWFCRGNMLGEEEEEEENKDCGEAVPIMDATL